MKISIIGAGNVGGLTAMRILEEGIADVVLVDVIKGLSQAKALDLDDARHTTGHNSCIEGTEDISKIKGSDIVVVTAGLARRPGMSREDLLKKNYSILKEVSKSIKNFAANAIIIVVSNPVDIMTYVLLKETGFERSRVLGMGSSLDSSRFNNLISKKLNLPCSKIKTLVMGSHGQTMILLPRFSSVDGKPLEEILKKQEVDELVELTKNRGAQIVSLFGSGSAYFAPSAAILEIVKIIINNLDRQIPLSVYLEGEYGLSDVCIGVPVRLNRDGIKEMIELDLNQQEKEQFLKSAKSIREGINIIYPK